MNRQGVEELLQECLAGLDAGLTPEECLSAWPGQRSELEPLLREAMQVRIALTVAPREDFRQRLHEKVMFVAGREAKAALSHEPDQEFVERTRHRFRNVAGQTAQEALHAVPPPRLAFWMNARRRLLEAAASTSMPAPKPQPSGAVLVRRASMSFAVLALAAGIATVALFSGGNEPSVNAEFAALEQQLQEVEQRSAAGEVVSPSILLDLSRRTAQLAEKAGGEAVSPPFAEMLPTLIERQQMVISQAAIDSELQSTALQQAQAQLTQAEENVRIRSARSDTPVAQSSAAAGTTSTTPLVPPAPSVTPTATAVLPLPGPGQVRVLPLPNDTTFGLSWQEVMTREFRVVVPADWDLVGVTLGSGGIANLDFPFIRMDGSGVMVLIGTSTGQINAIVNGHALTIRGSGPVAPTITVEELVTSVPGYAREFSHILETVHLTAAQSTSTPTTPATLPTAQPTPVLTPLPTVVPVTATPVPPTPAPTQPAPTATSTPPAAATPPVTPTP